jgi:hypothetical protein
MFQGIGEEVDHDLIEGIRIEIQRRLLRGMVVKLQVDVAALPVGLRLKIGKQRRHAQACRNPNRNDVLWQSVA